jgi:hypothetical protein
LNWKQNCMYIKNSIFIHTQECIIIYFYCAHTFYWVVFLFAWAKCIKMLNFIMFLNALVWIELNPFPMFLSLFYLNSYECFPCQKHYNTNSNFHRSIIFQYISKCNLLVVKIYLYIYIYLYLSKQFRHLFIFQFLNTVTCIRDCNILHVKNYISFYNSLVLESLEIIEIFYIQDYNH